VLFSRLDIVRLLIYSGIGFRHTTLQKEGTPYG
jgi:hypothetical protein